MRSQAGSFYAGSRWFNGYQVIEVDFVLDKTNIYCREYFPTFQEFRASANLTDADPLILDYSIKDQSPNDQVELFLHSNRNEVKSRFTEHLNFVNNDSFKQEDLISGYACPKLFIQNESKIDESGNLSDSYRVVKVDSMLSMDSDILIHGVRQSGKTALKHYLAYRYAYGIGCSPKIPIFIDVAKFQWNFYAVKRALQTSFSIPTKFRLEEAVKNGHFVFFFEDIGQLDQDGLERLKKFAENFKPCRFFVFGSPDEHLISKERHFKKTLTKFVAVGLGELTRGAIRKMTQSWFSDNQEAKANFDLVVGQINRDGLPRTAYMVGLLLWAAKQGQKGDRLNEALLLQNVLDHLLDRANFRAAKRGTLTTRGKELLLNEIANKFDCNSSRAKSFDVISWVDNYFDRKKLSYDSSEVVNELVNCGILRREEGKIEFRFKCFQEYYIAQGMVDASERELKTGGMKFLKRGREIELLSGLQGENAPLIENILEVLTSRMPQDLAGVSYADFSRVVYGCSNLSVSREKIRKIRRTRLTEEQLDQVMDAVDERAAGRGDRPVSESLDESGGDVVGAASSRQAEAVDRDVEADSEALRPGTFMAGLSILARVLRNSDHTDYGPPRTITIFGCLWALDRVVGLPGRGFGHSTVFGGGCSRAV